MIQFFSKKLKNKKGFTLVELLIVIALLGILAGIAIPRMTGLTDDARANADAATAQTLMRDAQVAIVSGQLTTAATAFTNVTGDGVTGTYFDSGVYDMPTSQVTGKKFIISVKLQSTGSAVYDIQITNGWESGDNGSLVTTKGVAESIGN